MKKIIILLMTVFLLYLLVLPVNAVLTGDDVLARIEEEMHSTTAHLQMNMKLYSASGDVREREMEIYKSNQEGLTKSFVRFLSPATIEGTAFLSLEQENGSEDMYLYMPALGSVRKIASSQRNGSFVGTDFSFNDLTILGGANFREDYQASILEENDQEYVLKLIPTNPDIEYNQVKMWVDKANWYPLKSEFYDADGELLKVMNPADHKEINGYWTPQKLTMENVQKGTKTVIEMVNVVYDQSVNEQIFSVRYLKR
ncbi:MAG: hypothetical protein PWR10_2099 [Halanaerobiales bacterium]|nr:hypothetical protein [Halanaerobiales bacterium]